MATSNNVLQITTKGLEGVCRELTNKRIFDKSKINIVGTPKIENGVASLLSENNYFTHSGLTFGEEKVVIEFSGNYVSSSAVIYQIAWTLSESTTPSNNMSLRVFENKISLFVNYTELIALENITVRDNDFVNISVTISNKAVNILAFIGDEVHSIKGNYATPILISNYDELSIGNANPGNLYFWYGSVNLPSFGIYKKDSLYYTPSLKNTLRFTKILIGDGVYPLSDTSIPIINHVYEFPIIELKKSGNNILLSSQIGSTAHLNIKELGLYVTTEEGSRLFAIIDSLAIRKESNLGYNLIFNVSLDVNVVNTNLLPEIIFPNKDISNFENFNKVRMSFLKITESLERCIKGNSNELGRHLAQHLYRQERKLELLKENWNAVDSCNKLCNKFRYKAFKKFLPESIEKIGNISVTDNGLASGFSTDSYVTTGTFPGDLNSFEMNIPFTTSSNISPKQTIFNAADDFTYAPFEVYISNQKCYVSGSEKRKITTENSEYFRNFYDSRVISDVTYNAWKNYNGTIVYSLSTTPSVGDDLYEIRIETVDDQTIYVPYLLEETVIGVSGNKIIETSFDIEALTKYILRVVFDGSIYKFLLSKNDKDFIEISNFIINKVLESGDNCFFGLNSGLTDPFLGSIDLTDYSVITSDSSYCLYKLEEIKVILNEFIHISNAHKHFFKAVDLKDKNKFLEVFDGNCSGDSDTIDFTEGSTLSLKIDFKTSADKVVFTKIRKDPEADIPEYYLKIYLYKYNLYVEISSSTSTVQVVKNYGMDKIHQLIKTPVSIHIVSTGSSFTIYLNNEIIGSPGFAEPFDLSSSDYKIVTSYASDIINMSGSATAEDIHYLNNILDTNFGEPKFIITSDGTFQAKFFNTEDFVVRDTITYYIWECENQSYTHKQILLTDKEPSSSSAIYNTNYELIPSLHIISF